MNIDKIAKELKKISPLPNMPREVFESLKDLLPIAAVELLIIRRDGSFVLIKKEGQFNGWALPSGYIGLNESLKTACQRIAERDIGSKLRSAELLTVFNWPEGSLRPAKGHAISILFRCEAKSYIQKGKYFSKVPPKTLRHHRRMIAEALFAR